MTPTRMKSRHTTGDPAQKSKAVIGLSTADSMTDPTTRRRGDDDHLTGAGAGSKIASMAAAALLGTSCPS